MASERQRVVVIINPISGANRRSGVGDRTALARAFIRDRAVVGEVFVAERCGHARDLAREAVEQGAGVVVAWGGDGTINEVASALAFGATPLGIVPSGSGNGLARGLRIPTDPERALALALDGRDRRLDVGEMDGRFFVNVAGVGLDARIAHRFAKGGNASRGPLRYVEAAAREIVSDVSEEYTVSFGSTQIRERALLIAVANGREYGNGAIVAPRAIPDDGQLDVVVVAARPVWQVVAAVPKLFSGRADEIRNVTMGRAESVQITAERPIAYHVDGEPCVGGTSLLACVRPCALTVRVP